MAAGSFTITGLSASEPAGERIFGPVTIIGQQVIGETLSLSLAQGDNTVVVPSGSVCAWVQAATTGNANLTLRTNLNSSDAGLPVNGTGYPLIYPFGATTPTTLIINASVAQSAPITVAFI